MALDSAGWNQSSSSALVQGLQTSATYDPTVQNSTMPTSAVGAMDRSTQSQPDAATTGNPQQAANLASVNSGATTTAPLSATAQNNMAFPSWLAQSKVANSNVSVAPSSGAAPSAQGVNAQPLNSSNALSAQTLGVSYAGPQVVAVVGQDGAVLNYQRWNPNTNQYTFAGKTPPPGANAGAIPTVPLNQVGSIWNPDYDGQVVANAAYKTQLGEYQTALQNAQAQAKAQQAQQVVTGLTTYMMQNGGKTPDQAGMTGTTYTPEQIAAATTAYNQQIAQQQADKASASLISAGVAPVDVSSVEAANQAALNSMLSQRNVLGGGADAGALQRAGAGADTAQLGQNANNLATAYGSQYDANLKAFSNALQSQATTDANASAQKLSYDMQQVQDMAALLAQHIDQLDTQSQQAVNQMIIQINQQVQQYQQAVAQFGQTSQQAMGFAQAALQAAASGSAAAVAQTGKK